MAMDWRWPARGRASLFCQQAEKMSSPLVASRAPQGRTLVVVQPAVVSQPTSPGGSVTALDRLQQAQLLFDRYDRDRSGFIDSQEMQDLLASEGHAVDLDLVNKCDSSGDGQFSFDEFVQVHNMLVRGDGQGNADQLIIHRISV